jgi:hypothetical protein
VDAIVNPAASSEDRSSGERDRIYVYEKRSNTFNFIVFNHRVAYVDEEPRAEMYGAQTGFASLWYRN